MIEVLGDKIKPVSEASSSSSKGSVAEESSSSVALSSSSRVRSSSSRTHRSSDSHNSSSSTAGAVVIGNAAPSLNVGKVSFNHGYLNVPVTLARNGDVKVRLYSVLGNEVASASELMTSGTNNVLLGRKNIPSGVYMLSVQSASSRIIKRIELGNL